MIRHFGEMLNEVRSNKKRIRLSVAAAHDEHVLKSVFSAHENGICDAILVGDGIRIEEMADHLGIPQNTFEIINIPSDVADQCDVAINQVIQGRAHCLMKGIVETSVMLQAVLKQKDTLLRSNQMNHIAVFDIKKYHKLLFICDSAMIIFPTLEQKKQMILNAIPVMRAFGIRTPKVVTICAKESIDLKMPATVDAGELLKMGEKGDFPDCQISGPMAMDVAISKDAAEHKGLAGTLGGDADLLVMPNIEAGNTLYKTLIHFASAEGAGIIVGASMPIILTSRSDEANTKMNAIALAALVAQCS
jgi:phosphate butyryltransferase